eukprot:CAMPEP_0182531796 /NCGR_PEP_ID=MMETSP1323-20130603/10106_1 /TAXON_ID=236787 /ORGANISM="Florenciella parvula, Strain RCC1693" /LENGTH=132 /DNA_ID=CAMNT_0024741431 /DNA_START=127 /DNA_END=524 /DNA_ORIENTATION=+
MRLTCAARAVVVQGQAKRLVEVQSAETNQAHPHEYGNELVVVLGRRLPAWRRLALVARIDADGWTLVAASSSGVVVTASSSSSPHPSDATLLAAGALRQERGRANARGAARGEKLEHPCRRAKRASASTRAW